MTLVTAEAPWPALGRPFTVTELDRLPDDGRRYELLDGVLVVSPRPTPAHQVVAFTLATSIAQACPPSLQVVPEPAVMVSSETELAPDIALVRREQLAGSKITEPPVLVVEVRSPRTALIDLNRKKEAYERFGVRWYLVVGPDPDKPELLVFGLAEGRFRQVALVTGDEQYVTTEPFGMEIVPSRLVAGLLPG